MAGEYRLVERSPTADEFLALRRDAGWLTPNSTAVRNALCNSFYCVCVEHRGQCIGPTRRRLA